MGAWGEDPTQSDDFGDMWDKIFRPRGIGSRDTMDTELQKLMQRKLRSPDERWARVGIVYRFANTDGTIDLAPWFYKFALSEVAKLMDDPEWIERWRSPTKIRAKLSDVYGAIELRLRLTS